MNFFMNEEMNEWYDGRYGYVGNRMECNVMERVVICSVHYSVWFLTATTTTCYEEDAR